MIIFLALFPLIDIYGHRFCYLFNKGLYIDMYIPKCDRDKIWEVVNK